MSLILLPSSALSIACAGACVNEQSTRPAHGTDGTVTVTRFLHTIGVCMLAALPESCYNSVPGLSGRHSGGVMAGQPQATTTQNLWQRMNGPLKIGVVFAAIGIVLTIIGVFRDPTTPVTAWSLGMGALISGATWGVVELGDCHRRRRGRTRPGARLG